METSAVATPAVSAAASPMAPGRVVSAYLTEMRFESLRMLREPSFAAPFLVLPLVVYLLFGVVIASEAIAGKPSLANYLFSGFSVMAVAGPAIFGIGIALATERKAGLMTIKRAWPVPGGAYLLAKMVMAMLFAGLAMVLLIITALAAGRITLSAGQLVVMGLVMTLGAVPFCAIGLFIGAYTTGSAAPAFANLVYLPMLWLSGIFFPLPDAMKTWVVIWPTFHLNQVALGVAGVTEFSFVPPQIAAAVLVGVTVLFGGLAMRRLARKG